VRQQRAELSGPSVVTPLATPAAGALLLLPCLLRLLCLMQCALLPLQLRCPLLRWPLLCLLLGEVVQVVVTAQQLLCGHHHLVSQRANQGSNAGLHPTGAMR
jgi:hypothetical protein